MTLHDFNILLRSTYKSLDTEENIDIYFTRPIGLVFALFFRKIGWTPNAVTILSYFIGMGAAWMFIYPDLLHNVVGMLLLMTANFCDSADGQLARLTGKTSIAGRMLDGFATEFWFICIYLALTYRMWDTPIPFTETPWRIWFLVICCIAGFGGHNYQCRIADYYRNIHLFFLKGRNGAELDDYASQHALYQKYLRERNWTGVLFFANYSKYCYSQERSTPHFQEMKKVLREEYGSMADAPESFRDEFLSKSRPLMKYTNFISYNWRAIVLYAGCLANIPWISPVFELTILMMAALYLHNRHESLCQRLAGEYRGSGHLSAIPHSMAYIFDYGATLDTRGEHWSKVIYRHMQKNGLSIPWEEYWNAYVHTERQLGNGDIIKPTDTFLVTLTKKVQMQILFLGINTDITPVVQSIYDETLRVTHYSRHILQRLKDDGNPPMVLVSNFYGNIRTVLHEFGLDTFFAEVIESAEVGIRKPDSRIWTLGIEALQRVNRSLSPADITVVGDSTEKDILPAQSLGCKTMKIKTMKIENQ